MAPPRQRTAAIVDDSRSEASSGTREYRNTAPKSRKTATAKDKAAVTSAPAHHDQHADEQPRVRLYFHLKGRTSVQPSTRNPTHTHTHTQSQILAPSHSHKLTNIIPIAPLVRPPTRYPPRLPPRPQTPHPIRLFKRLLPHRPLPGHRPALPNRPRRPPRPILLAQPPPRHRIHNSRQRQRQREWERERQWQWKRES